MTEKPTIEEMRDFVADMIHGAVIDLMRNPKDEAALEGKRIMDSIFDELARPRPSVTTKNVLEFLRVLDGVKDTDNINRRAACVDSWLGHIGVEVREEKNARNEKEADHD